MSGITILLSLTAITFMGTEIAAQNSFQQQTLVINGHSGSAMVYRIDGKSYVDLEAIATIAKGSVHFSEDKIVLTLSGDNSADVQSSNQAAAPGMSAEFMKASLQGLTILREWSESLAYAIQRGVPGDGSRLLTFHNRATDQLRLAKIDASNQSDLNALQLLTKHFNGVSTWSDKLVAERKSMNTAKYSITPDALANDESYQKITKCADFLRTMVSSGQFEDNGICN